MRALRVVAKRSFKKAGRRVRSQEGTEGVEEGREETAAGGEG